jgi:hypothetical protein
MCAQSQQAQSALRGLCLVRAGTTDAQSLGLVRVFLGGASVAFLTGVIGGACRGVYPVVGMAVAIAFGIFPVAFRSRPRAQ